jgi:hypothetical protein
MSYQRAVINCRACCKLAKGCQGQLSLGIVGPRNEALNALEHLMYMQVLVEAQNNRTLEGAGNISAALDACMNCDFKSPKIAEVYDGGAV